MLRPRLLAMVAATALLLAGCGGGSGAATPTTSAPATSAPATSPAATPAPAAPASATPAPGETGSGRKVLVIVEENKTFAQALGGGDAPYLTGLAGRYGLATEMDAGYPSGCPSLAAYVLMTSGSTHGICDDRNPSAHPLTGPSIFSQVATSGREWRSYAEAMPGTCRLTNSDDGRYAVRHVPATYYLSERERCARWTVPLGTVQSGTLHDDLAAGQLPAFSMVTPDLCNDMHGASGCGPQVATGDAWLAAWMPQILAGPDYRSGRLVVMVTWDEGTPGDNHIPAVMISPATRGIRSAQPWTHCSALRTWQELLDLPPLGCAAAAPSMRQAFRL